MNKQTKKIFKEWYQQLRIPYCLKREFLFKGLLDQFYDASWESLTLPCAQSKTVLSNVAVIRGYWALAKLFIQTGMFCKYEIHSFENLVQKREYKISH